MLILAATTAPLPATTLDKLRAIPPDFWWRLLLAIVVLVLLVVFLRKVAKMNKVVLAAVTFIMVTVVGFNWIYERSEPPWATPVVNFMAGFLPSKGPPPKTTPPPTAKRRT
jgi:apolipoprotein N-acyltransferase